MGLLKNWIDEEFFQTGAFITAYEDDFVLLAKGGEILTEDQEFRTGCFYLKDFYHNHYLTYRPESWIKVSLEELKELQNQNQVKIIETRSYDEVYARDFEKLKHSFGENLQKVVLISREEYKVSDAHALKQSLFLKSLHFGSGHPSGIWGQGFGIIGSTPEILYSLKGLELKTFALAATMKKGQEDELLNSSKDRREHDLVIEHIEEILKEYSSEVIHESTQISGYQNLIHLKTKINARLSANTDLRSLTSSLSPTAALGGYPKKESLEFLANSEYGKLFKERYFGSCMGVICDELTQFMVMIRNVEWRDEVFFIQSGGGVLSESTLQKELAEIELKRSTIKRHYL